MRRWLALSLLVHGLVLLAWTGRAHWPLPPLIAQRLTLYLHPPIAAINPALPTKTASAEKPATGRRQSARAVAGSVPPVPESARTQSPAAATTASIDAHSLLESSRAQIADESRRQMLDPMFSPSAKTPNVPASPLARATARAPAGERMLGDGILRITAADGKVHCLQRPPEITSRDIPGGVMAIPVTCPVSF